MNTNNQIFRQLLDSSNALGARALSPARSRPPNIHIYIYIYIYICIHVYIYIYIYTPSAISYLCQDSLN